MPDVGKPIRFMFQYNFTHTTPSGRHTRRVDGLLHELCLAHDNQVCVSVGGGRWVRFEDGWELATMPGELFETGLFGFPL